MYINTWKQDIITHCSIFFFTMHLERKSNVLNYALFLFRYCLYNKLTNKTMSHQYYQNINVSDPHDSTKDTKVRGKHEQN